MLILLRAISVATEFWFPLASMMSLTVKDRKGYTWDLTNQSVYTLTDLHGITDKEEEHSVADRRNCIRKGFYIQNLLF